MQKKYHTIVTKPGVQKKYSQLWSSPEITKMADVVHLETPHCCMSWPGCGNVKPTATPVTKAVLTSKTPTDVSCKEGKKEKKGGQKASSRRIVSTESGNTQKQCNNRQARPHQPMGRKFAAAKSRTELLVDSNCFKAAAAASSTSSSSSSSPHAAAALELALLDLPSCSSKRTWAKKNRDFASCDGDFYIWQWKMKASNGETGRRRRRKGIIYLERRSSSIVEERNSCWPQEPRLLLLLLYPRSWEAMDVERGEGSNMGGGWQKQGRSHQREQIWALCRKLRTLHLLSREKLGG